MPAIREPTLYAIKAILILDSDGKRILAKLILMSALTCLHDSISHILRGNIEKKPLMDNLDLVFLAVDELCDGGIIMECDSTALASRVGFKSEDMSISEQTMSQALQAAKEQIKMSLLR
nr:unnamed protein product [Spirometra erinaceieuropaei]